MNFVNLLTYMTTSLDAREFSSSNSLSLSCLFVFSLIAASSSLLTHTSEQEKRDLCQFISVMGQSIAF